jgi:hypothetical protein
MITYNSVALKDDQLFIGVAKRALRGEFELVVHDARGAFQQAYSNEPNPLRKVNAARRAANLVILAALKGYGITNWREIVNKEPPARRKVVQTSDSGVSPRPKRWEGKTINQMIDENLAK